MWSILKIELYKIFRRPRTYIAFVAIAAIVLLIQLALFLDGKTYIGFLLQTVDRFEVNGRILNGYFVCYFILQTLLIHVPLLIALVGGDMLAGEANLGTLRLLACRPVSRSQIVLAKFLATVVYTLLLLLWMALLSLGLSILLFGADDVMIFQSSKLVQIREADTLWRYVAAFGFAALAMVTVAALSFLLSLFANNSIGPIVATMSIVIVFTILSTMDLPLFLSLKPFLFTSHMLGWKGFFDVQTDAANRVISGSVYNIRAIGISALWLLGHIALFLGLSLYIFRKKDILS